MRMSVCLHLWCVQIQQKKIPFMFRLAFLFFLPNHFLCGGTFFGERQTIRAQQRINFRFGERREREIKQFFGAEALKTNNYVCVCVFFFSKTTRHDERNAAQRQRTMELKCTRRCFGSFGRMMDEMNVEWTQVELNVLYFARLDLIFRSYRPQRSVNSQHSEKHSAAMQSTKLNCVCVVKKWLCHATRHAFTLQRCLLDVF